ncbi:MAG: undecaprenyl-diphosphate phosphatase [Crocinitomicaceae bacterium]|nr:undecaprenyl-diphosphate phosphatase [Flavobacteriales bacterium]NQZ35730.1 undecaprenyl-diphosphate phosphatase [Crocinitomicaceae bacterium]
MSLLDAIILGIIQGLTEFLPVSSSGHLEIMKAIQGQELSGESSMMMTIVLHFATALSTIAVFWKEVTRIIKGLFQFKINEEFLFSAKIVISMIPAALIGVFYDDFIETFFSGKILLVGVMLIVTGIILFIAERAKRTDKPVGFKDAILIGIAQMIAILPGISRSGATIGTSVMLGIDREKAARFSFLMVVPLILGKVAKDVLSPEFSKELANSEISSTVYAAGFASAFIVGIIACAWMIKLVKKSKLSYFAYYCFAAGTATICWSTFG